MDLVRILKAWEEYPTRLLDRSLEKPYTVQDNGLAHAAIMIAESVVAGGLTYYITADATTSWVAAGVALIGRGIQTLSYAHKKIKELRGQ